MGADPTTFGQLQTVFAVAQLMGGPFFGRAGDTLGEKFALILAFTGAMMSYLLMGLAESISILFLSRLPSVVMHTMQGILDSYYSGIFGKGHFADVNGIKVTSDERRAVWIGFFSFLEFEMK